MSSVAPRSVSSVVWIQGLDAGSMLENILVVLHLFLAFPRFSRKTVQQDYSESLLKKLIFFFFLNTLVYNQDAIRIKTLMRFQIEDLCSMHTFLLNYAVKFTFCWYDFFHGPLVVASDVLRMLFKVI